MTRAFSLGALLLLLGSASCWAGDAQVPRSTLNSLGLGAMQVISDAEGQQVRGQFTFSVRSTGSSFYAYQLMGPTMTTFGSDGGAAVSTTSGVAATTSLMQMDSLMDGLFFSASVNISIGSSGSITVSN